MLREQAVDQPDLGAHADEPVRQVGADEAQPAGDQDLAAFELHFPHAGALSERRSQSQSPPVQHCVAAEAKLKRLRKQEPRRRPAIRQSLYAGKRPRLIVSAREIDFAGMPAKRPA